MEVAAVLAMSLPSLAVEISGAAAPGGEPQPVASSSPIPVFTVPPEAFRGPADAHQMFDDAVKTMLAASPTATALVEGDSGVAADMRPTSVAAPAFLARPMPSS